MAPHRSLALAAAAAVLAGTTAWAASVDHGATGGAPADREQHVRGDAVVVFDVGEVDAEVVAKAAQVADASGGSWTTSRTGSLGTRSILRSGASIHGAPDGFLTPMIYVAFPAATLGWVVGFDAAAAATPNGTQLRAGLNERTAALTGASAGDLIEVVTRAGTVVRIEVGAIVPDSILGGAELVITTATADALGEPPDTRAVIWGFDTRDQVEAALAASGLEQRRNTGVARSWDQMSPDSTLGTLTVKERLGEPWYQLDPDPESSFVTMHPAWRAAHLTSGRILLSEGVPIVARCHVRIVDDLRAALDEVAAAGLVGAFDVDNANTYGGCYAPRFSRGSGFLSRHALGMALDTNTVTNCQGCTPQMNCDVVRIFRKHKFAWGGNFSRHDGMHFEWVGEPRDQIPYDSDFCDNIVTEPQPTDTTTTTSIVPPEAHKQVGEAGGSPAGELGARVLMAGVEAGE